jgi:hypothetical protein
VGLYTRQNRVVSLLEGKIRFTSDVSDENKFSFTLLKTLIDQAESDVELDLSPRYAAPFQTDQGQPFSQLPLRPTQNYIMTLCELMSCIRVLETDFGRAMLDGGDKYAKVQQDRYKAMLDRLTERRKVSGEETLQWKYPPLPGLMLSYMNDQGDDGFAGRVYVTSDGRGDYPSSQINSPSENFWTGEIDRLDQDGPDGWPR